MHIWQRRGGRKRRAGPAPPCSAASGSRGPHRCQMLCSCLRRFLSLHAPHPSGSSSLRFLGGESEGDLPSPPLLRPRLPEPSAPTFSSFTLGLTSPHPPPTSPRPLAPFLLLPAPDPGGSLPSLASRCGGCLLRSWLRARLAPRAKEGRRRQRRASLIAFLLLPLPAFPIFPQRRGCTELDQPNMGREKAGEPQGARPWAAGAWAAGAGEMLAAGSSHRLRGADRIRGLEQLREQGSSKRQMVLDGSQGRVSGVGNRSQSNRG